VSPTTLPDAPFLALWYVKAAVLSIFVAYAAVSLVGIYRLTYGQPLADLAPDGSYLQTYDKVNKVSGLCSWGATYLMQGQGGGAKESQQG
jgi:hypothetical protein